MAGTTIRIIDEAVRATLWRLVGRLGNLTDVMDEIGGRWINLAKIGFLKEQAPDGTPWKPLAVATILARAKTKHWPGPILRVSGELFRSLNWKAFPNAVEIGAGWGASSPYAAIQMFGGPAGRGHSVEVPARRYMPESPLPDLYLRTCIDIINQHLGDVING
jgi:phage gpG-like protein